MMVKKVQKSAADTEPKKAPRGSLLDGLHLARSVKDSAQQIWLAGMGAFSRAQGDGNKIFETLISEGMKLQRRTQGMAEETISEVTGRMSSLADGVSAKAGQQWDKLEAIFEQRTAKAMSKLGVPTAKDVAALTARVDELAAAVAKLAKTTKAAPKAAAGNGSSALRKAPARRAAGSRRAAA
jgi:poly(hydroxyalkanoate) granule-associated protein